jgi:hypothetical protein
VTPLGNIVRLQVQTGPLKSGEKPNRVYETARLREVERLVLSPNGAVGFTAAGEAFVDVHNTSHPSTRNEGHNPVSFGLTSHYARMRERFGARMIHGCAGENILVESDRALRMEDLGLRIALQSAGNGELLELMKVVVALPCVEFSRFALQRQDATPEELKPVLQFLDEGTRGFYFIPARDGFTVRVGDALVRL